MSSPRTVRSQGQRAAHDSAMAELVAEGASVYAAGQQMSLTRGEAVSTWRRICRSLGEYAS